MIHEYILKQILQCSKCYLFLYLGFGFLSGTVRCFSGFHDFNVITLVNTIFVTIKLFSVSDIIFYTEFKYVLSFSISHKVFKGHTVII
jgi:hypothetical protein